MMKESGFKIMLVAVEKDKSTSLYRYLLNEDGTVYEAVDGIDEATGGNKAASAFLEEKVEEMLNTGKYAKSDFIIVKDFEYAIETDIYA